MKKLLLLLVFALATTILQAQEKTDLYSLLFYEEMDCIQGLMQQHDGDFIVNTYLYEDIGNYNYISLGNVFYKISSATFAVTDSLFIADTMSYLSVQNPQGEDNIRVNFEYQEDRDSCFLRISHFPDNDLHTSPEEDIVTPVCKGYPYEGDFTCMVDCRGDLILQYCKEIDIFHFDVYVARFDVYGTMKCHTLLHENAEMDCAGSLHVLKESPLQYYQWGWADTGDHGRHNLVVYVLDSLFHKNSVIINSLLSEEVIYPDNPYILLCEYFNLDGDAEVIPCGGDDILLAAKYEKDTTGYPMSADLGVVVAKYDLRTMQLKDYIVFNDYPGYYNPAKCLGLKMMTDGTVYFLYKEHGYPEESIVVVKMDTNLNVEWKRFYKTDNIDISGFDYSIVDKDEYGEEQGIAWAGYGRNTSNNHYGGVCFFLNHDGPVNVMEESGIEMRPYAFYPNPAKEQLHMEFSPDVQPKQIELFDLQGRLVRTQSKDFGSMDLSQLPAGTYTMHVTLEDGKTYSDKVVKE